MVDKRELFYPNKFKLTLFLMLIIPCITIFVIIFGNNYTYSNFNYFFSSLILVDPPLFLMRLSLFAVFGLVLSYLLGCFVDHFIQNEKIKIMIALLSGVVSLVIVYFIYKMVTEPIICDPVHIPSNNQTICDPVHQPSSGENYNIHVLNELNVDQSTVKNSLEECIQNLKL